MNKCKQCHGTLDKIEEVTKDTESTEVPNQEINEIRDTICDGCLNLFLGGEHEDIYF
jgi:uncharacterized protein with PIN domain